MASADRKPKGLADHCPMRVEFLIDGELSGTVLARFPELDSTRGPAGGTALFGSVTDRAHFDGVLSRFRDLGIAVVEFRQLPD
ncbi:MAG TPA: hypothetical protein VEX15_19245 [Nocardioidaceae bacterium]|nr:hypothetical protein [Nocardioidaceae bacterium]